MIRAREVHRSSLLPSITQHGQACFDSYPHLAFPSPSVEYELMDGGQDYGVRLSLDRDAFRRRRLEG